MSFWLKWTPCRFSVRKVVNLEEVCEGAGWGGEQGMGGMVCGRVRAWIWLRVREYGERGGAGVGEA